MIRKIAAGALQPGMYIHALGCSWVDHPFLLNRFLLRSAAEIEKILDAGITEVEIDTDRGADVPPPRLVPQPQAKPAPDASPSSPGLPGTRAARRAQRMAAAAAQPTPGAAAARALPVADAAGATAVGARAERGTAAASAAAPATPAARGVTPALTENAAPTVAPAAPQPGAATAAAAKPAPQQPAQRAAAGDEQPKPAEASAAPAQPQPAAPPPVAPAVAQPTARTTATEFREAKRVHAESARVVRDILADVRLGKQVSVERTRAVVTQMSEAILSNPGPLLALCRLKQKDQYTFLHCVSVSALLMVFARAAGFDEDAIRDAGLGGLLHDIGKMKVPQQTLNKAGPLTGEERAAMRGHVGAGVEILQATPGVPPVALQITAEHHERFDGSGYPRKLKGPDISPIGHMAALVDVYDAITSERVYHRALSPQDALRRLLDGSGTHFDPAPVQLLIKTLGIYPAASLVMLESGRLAIVVDQSSGNLLQPRVRVVYDTRKAAFVKPFDLDLARTAGHGGEDRILRHESPQKWSVDPVAYLLEDVA